MKTVELLVRFNVQVPDDCEDALYVDFTQTAPLLIDNMDILNFEGECVDYTIQEYETLDSSEV